MSNSLIPILNYTQAAQAVAACLRAKRAILLYGSPGVGKTSLGRDASRAVNLPCHILIGSNMDSTDIGGLPYRGADGHVHRELFPEIRAVVDAPGVLFLDEATTVPKSVEGPLLRLALERNAGGTQLHPDACILLAANPPEQAPGASDLSAAMINRVVVIRYAPSLDEVRGFFSGRPVVATPAVVSAAELPEAYRLEALDFAATCEADPSMIMLDPPQASIDASAPWGSPRAWEIGLSVYAANGSHEDDVGFALLAGAVGPEAAATFLGVRKLRQYLPTISDVIARPDTAIVPSEIDQQIAALGVIARVAETDTEAGWIYAERLGPEPSIAACRHLMNKYKVPAKQSKRNQAAREAMTRLVARVGRARGAV